MKFYSHGNHIGVMEEASSVLQPAVDHFSIGSAVNSNNEPMIGFLGGITEIRIWDSARSREQLDDNRYRPLTGHEDRLVGYWPLGVNGKQTTDDVTGNGNNGSLIGAQPPVFEVSGAPVTNEGPWVKNAYSGVPTEMQQQSSGNSSVVDYNDVQQLDDGSLIVVRKRIYSFVDQQLGLHTGYKIGDLDLVYIGQVQTNPSLIGFVEGGPPVPSENLSMPGWENPVGETYDQYGSVTSITLQQSEEHELSFSTSSSEAGVFDISVAGGYNMEDEWQSPPVVLPPTPQKTIAKGKVKLGAMYQHSSSWGVKNDAAVSSSWSTISTDTVETGGDWEPKLEKQSDYIDPSIGRRYLIE